MKIKQVRRAFVVMKFSLSGKPVSLQSFIAKRTLAIKEIKIPEIRS